MSHFYLTLPSDSSSKFYPENSTASFKTKLSDRIDLNEEYEVGLAQFIYPYSWYNFNNEDQSMFITFHSEDGKAVKHVFKSGQFPNENAFLNILNQWIEKLKITGFRFNWDLWQRKVQLHIQNTGRSVYMSKAFATRLGFESEGPYKAAAGEGWTQFNAERTFDLHAGLRLIYLYSDIVSHTLVGDAKVPLLRVCVTEGQYGEMVSTTFTDPHYIPLARSALDTIEININNELGTLVPFEFGKSVVTLHFRRKNRLI